MLKGKLYATKDMNLVVNLVGYGAKALYMGDPASAPKNIDFIKPTILIPDLNLMTLYIDGQIQSFVKAYERELNRPQSHEMFATIIGALYFGSNVVMYFPPEVEDIGYSEILLRYMMNNYGIIAETKNTHFQYDINKHQFNIRLLYLYNIINVVDYILATDTLDDIIIDKIKRELPTEWGIPQNINNARFTELIENRKQQIIKYGKVLPVLMTKIEN